MWDPAVEMFQDRAYLLSAKCEIARKLQWDSGMYINIICCKSEAHPMWLNMSMYSSGLNQSQRHNNHIYNPE